MNFLDKMERKYGRYALKNLPMFIIATYVAGYVLETSDAGNARIFDSGAILHSARAGMATGDVDSDSAVKSRYFYDHHAVFLFLNRTDTRANVGQLQVLMSIFFRD